MTPKIKDLDYYMNLPYKIHVERFEDDDRGNPHYHAWIDELGKFSCFGCGNTEEEAKKSLECDKKEMLQLYLDRGEIIPEPKNEADNE